MEEAPPHIAMFTTIGKGHLFPFLEFARNLLRLHNFSITLIVPEVGSPAQTRKKILQTLPGITPIFLHGITLDDLPAGTPIEVITVLSVTRSIPALCEALTDLKQSSRISAFVTDFFGSFVLEAIKKLQIPAYTLFISSAMAVSFGLYMPELDRIWDREFRDLPEPVRLPGCAPINSSDFLPAAQDRKSPAYKAILEMCSKFSQADGMLIDSFLDLEPEALNALQDEDAAKPPVYVVGPLVRSGSEPENSDCLKWLDEQPDRSVLYVAFGSGGTLSSNQLKELAVGLEMSRQRFLMVVGVPNDIAMTATYFTDHGEAKTNPSDYLPGGFVERTKGKGLVVLNWAPQVEVLKHPAVGGFLTHCGWNSVLESIVHGGVPLIAWPLFAEQRMNAVLVVEGLKVAMRVTEDENGMVDHGQISRMVTSLIEGEQGMQFRKKMERLKEAAGRALEENGSSSKAIGRLLEIWK